MSIFQRLESEVRSYCRSFPAEFTRAKSARLWDTDGRTYLDFFAGAGALNYGHNEDRMKSALVDYIAGDGVTHSLDLHTSAKRQFLEAFERFVLKPRDLDYRVQFPGPTGTNAVEAAMKLARKVTGRRGIASFTNAFHGMTLGSLSVTGNQGKRDAAGTGVEPGTVLPFCGYFEDDFDGLAHFERMLEDGSSGVDLPAAIIVETVQAEGGVNVASMSWLRRLSELARRHEILLIVDDIQAGCGRTGAFFSFEEAGIVPDIVCLSKSLSGYGLPFAVVLMRPELDIWEPGEHNGTFRGHNLAFVTARVALETFWADSALSESVREKSEVVRAELRSVCDRHTGPCVDVRGRGLMMGIECEPGIARRASQLAFEKGLLIETAGVDSQVLKVLCPLVIPMEELREGLAIVTSSIERAVGEHRLDAAAE